MTHAAIASLLLALLSVAAPPLPAQAERAGEARWLQQVQRFETASNEARFDALAALLNDRMVPFEVQPFSIDAARRNEPRTEGRNVIVTIGSGEPRIVVGAHYDAVRLPDGSLSRGAVDNAASSVILVHAADALRKDPPSATVQLVFFDMEELGLEGSRRFLEAHSAAGTPPIRAMINLDINAFGDAILYGASTTPANRDLRTALRGVCAAQDVPCLAFRQMPRGDDRTFADAGIPTISMAILPELQAHQLWLRLHGGAQSGLADGPVPEILGLIHTAEDRSARVEPAAMQRVFDVVLALVRRLAG